MLRWVLRHKDLETMTRPGQHPRVAAAYDCDYVIGRAWEKENRLSYDGSLVTAFYTQVLVPVLGKDLGLTYEDHNKDSLQSLLSAGRNTLVGGGDFVPGQGAVRG